MVCDRTDKETENFPIFKVASGGPPGQLAAWQVRWGRAPQHTSLKLIYNVCGQGFASPVPPFAAEIKHFHDEPGARPLTK